MTKVIISHTMFIIERYSKFITYFRLFVSFHLMEGVCQEKISLLMTALSRIESRARRHFLSYLCPPQKRVWMSADYTSHWYTLLDKMLTLYITYRTFRSPVGWMKKCLEAKLKVEAYIKSKRSLRGVIFRPSLLWTKSRPQALPSVIPFYIGSAIGLPFVDRPVLLEDLSNAILLLSSTRLWVAYSVTLKLISCRGSARYVII